MKSAAVPKIWHFREPSQTKNGRTEGLLSYFTDKELNNREIKVRTEAVAGLGTSPSLLSSLQNSFSFWKILLFIFQTLSMELKEEQNLDQAWYPESQ